MAAIIQGQYNFPTLKEADKLNQFSNFLQFPHYFHIISSLPKKSFSIFLHLSSNNKSQSSCLVLVDEFNVFLLLVCFLSLKAMKRYEERMMDVLNEHFVRYLSFCDMKVIMFTYATPFLGTCSIFYVLKNKYPMGMFVCDVIMCGNEARMDLKLKNGCLKELGV